MVQKRRNTTKGVGFRNIRGAPCTHLDKATQNENSNEQTFRAILGECNHSDCNPYGIRKCGDGYAVDAVPTPTPTLTLQFTAYLSGKSCSRIEALFCQPNCGIALGHPCL